MAKDYKDTLNLPNTDFPMKANLAQREPDMLAFWQDHGIHEKIPLNNAAGPRYILHDGPPYANGHIHIGHALNKILKDMIVKYRSMKGFYAPYVPGWDCHGLPIEHQVDKNLGGRKSEVGILEKRRLCREYALQFLDIQREEFKRLGVTGFWQKPYLTLDYDYEATILDEFYKFLHSGHVYRGKKPVHWCTSCVTALAEAEVEYGDKTSPSIYVTFDVLDEDARRIVDSGPLSIVIWTTTPWTLPANLALAVHPEVDYAVVYQEGRSYLVAEPLVQALARSIGLSGETVKTVPGSTLAGIRTAHPFADRISPVVSADFVTVEDGTGVVHIAPGHGEDDYLVGLRHGLDILTPVDDKGIFTKQAGPFEGQFVYKANALIIDTLRQKGALIKQQDITHSYPHCWRCKQPVIFRATEQWFISLAKDGLRRKCLEEIDQTAWIPSWGRERIHAMVTNRPDWCISRQRSWGVPIAVLLCKECGEAVADKSVTDGVVARFRQWGADVWFDKEARDFLPEGYICTKCGGSDFVKEMDILDVWFDSGVSHAAVLERDERLSSPAALYLEGSDQHRGWFQSSLITSTGARGRSPFKAVLTHGFVVDGKGRKMSKSVGNVIAPQDIIKKNGAEIVRLWVAGEDYRNDIRISNEILQRLTEAYRKIRNTCRFLLGNLYDYDGRDYTESLLEVDRWAMSRLQSLVRKVTASYESFDFHEVFHGLYNFCIVDMSSFYLDILKDRVYTFKKDSSERRAAQWTMVNILSVMTRLMAPILSFTAEEIWQSQRRADASGKQNTASGRGGDALISFAAESVFLSSFPEVDERFLDERLEKKWEGLIAIRDVVNKALELKRQDRVIGNALEAKVVIYAAQSQGDGGMVPQNDSPAPYNLLVPYLDFLPTLFIVSQAEVLPLEQKNDLPEGARCTLYAGDDKIGVVVAVDRAEGRKCERCWNISTSVGQADGDDNICHRCSQAITPTG